jgi:tetratricopeptide (TPR) repeat protein
MVKILSRVLAALCLTLCLGFAQARAADRQASSEAIYRQTLRGTVLILIKDQGRIVGNGSGWIADTRRRLLVTNHHVVGNQDTAWVVFPAYRNGRVIAEKGFYPRHTRQFRGKVLDSDPGRDLAVIQLESLPRGGTALRPASRSPSPGQALHSIGNPGVSGAFWVYTKGAVRSVVRRRIPYGNGRQIVDTTVIETTSATNPGDSGGPVVNDAGQLVGVTSGASGAARLMSIAIDVGVVKGFLREVQVLLNSRTATAAAFYGRGRRYLSKKVYDRAIADFGRALGRRHVPANLRAALYRSRGLAFHGKRSYDSALTDFNRALKLNPKDAAAYNGRGHIYLEKRDFGQAVANYSRAIQLQPKVAILYRNRAYVYRALRDHARALADYDKAIGLEPAEPLGRLGRAVCYYFRKEYPRAVIDLNGVLRQLPRHPWAWYWRGAAFEAQGLFAKAQQDYRQAIKVDPKMAKAIPEFNRCYLKVVNRTNQPLKVYLRYEALRLEALGWKWLPADPRRPLVFELAPGASRVVTDGGARIEARKLRIWAEGRDGAKWARWKTQDLVLVKDSYRCRQRWTSNFTFGR